MSPIASGPAPRAALLAVVIGGVLGAGFLTLRDDHALISRQLAVTADGEQAATRRAAHERLVRTATDIAGHAWEWHLRPAAFGGGDGRWDGLSFALLGYATDADGAFRSTDGTFRLDVGPAGLEIVGEDAVRDVRTVVAIQRGDGPAGLQLVVDGQAVDGAPVTRRGPGPDLDRHAQLHREAEQLADFVVMVIESEDPRGDILRGRSLRDLRLADLHVDVDASGAFQTPYGPLVLSWERADRAVISGTPTTGGRIRVVRRVTEPTASRPPGESGVILPSAVPAPAAGQ